MRLRGQNLVMLSGLIAVLCLGQTNARSILEFGVKPEASAAENTLALQKAIDWASSRGAALFVDPSPEPYALNGGLVLKANVSLIGVHGPTGRGTKHPTKAQPVGSVFAIQDSSRPFITVESSSQIKGIQFWYPDQTVSDPTKVIVYPPTIQVSQKSSVMGVTLRDLTFYGEYEAMDFAASASHPCEQILIEHCYGYPLGGKFITISRCYDVPRILNCHVNPANLRLFRGDYSRSVIDSVVRRRTFTYSIDKTDNAQLTNLFTFGAFGGIHLGPASYGQLTGFNFDCVAVGVWKQGDNEFNRNWQLSQGSIISNTGEKPEDTVPVVAEGKGHLALTNVEAFSGPNGAITTIGDPREFLLVAGTDRTTVSLFGCRMRNYRGPSPVTLANPKGWVQAVACLDKNQAAVNQTWGAASPL